MDKLMRIDFMFKRSIKILFCVVFHKKEIKFLEVLIGKDLIPVNLGRARGCSMCNIWQQMHSDCK